MLRDAPEVFPFEIKVQVVSFRQIIPCQARFILCSTKAAGGKECYLSFFV